MGWRHAAVTLIVLAGCESRDVGPPATTAPPPIPVTLVELPVGGDFSVSPAAPGTELSTVSAESLDAGDGSVVLFAI
jgi:hypothetical protein